MDATGPAGAEETIGVASGWLRWRHEGDVLVAGPYRIRLRGPSHWETTYEGRVLRRDDRRSAALAGAEHHCRETRRVRQITRWALVAGAGLLAVTVAATWIDGPAGFTVFVVASGVFLGSIARCIAAASRNITDPFRAREPWEARNWYDH